MKLTVLDDRKVNLLLKTRDKIRHQAEENALTLFFMSICFVVTWVFIIADSRGWLNFVN